MLDQDRAIGPCVNAPLCPLPGDHRGQCNADPREATTRRERRSDIAVREIAHVSFNPTMDSHIGRICADCQRGGWALLHVVPIHAYEAVAVFERVTDV